MSTFFYTQPKDFKGKRVTVMGLGLSGGGLGAARFFAEQEAQVLVTDLRDPETLAAPLAQLKKYPIIYRLGQHQKEDFTNTDLVIKNPAVPWSSPYIQAAREANVPVDMEIGIFLALNHAPILGVTGTKGKTTTATLLYEIMKAQYPQTKLAGNVRVSPLEFIEETNTKTPVVLELSSFQLEIFADHKKSPHIAIITNIFADHMDRYASLTEYARAKENIFRFQTKGDVLILNKDDAWTGKFIDTVKAENIPSTLKFVSARECFFKPAEVGLPGIHNLVNIELAASAALSYGVEEQIVRRVVKAFKGVANRLELVTTVKGVMFYNDTTSTIPEATSAALATFTEPVILIAGGSEKNVEYVKLARDIVKKVRKLILLKAEASKRIATEVRKVSDTFEINYADSMREAVNLAAAAANSGDIVLLSPAAASFGLFKNEFDRGEQFIAAVKNLH